METPAIVALSFCAYIIIGLVCATIGDVISEKTRKTALEDAVYGVLYALWPFVGAALLAFGVFRVSRRLSSAIARYLTAERKEC